MTRPHKENNDHSHDHNGIFGPRTELYLSLLCGIFLAIGFSIKVFGADSQSMWNYIVPFLIAYGFGGYYITIEAFLKIKKG
ncbi:MAG TPA: hypothetical protein VNJ50_00125, partial [Gelidibacter sp.]|nr:hypothetical protein [Gelidibacter sp.]